MLRTGTPTTRASTHGGHSASCRWAGAPAPRRRSDSERATPGRSSRRGPANAGDATRPATIVQGGRAKAYRPLPAAERRAALLAGLEAYDRGDWFLAHELLEPAWMGTKDLAERELLQGLIKLAAAFVHDARSNPAGVTKNLRGARDRLSGGLAAGAQLGVEVAALLDAVDGWLVSPGSSAIEIPRRPIHDADGQPTDKGDTRPARASG